MYPSTSELVYTGLLRLIPAWTHDPLDALVSSKAFSLLRSFQTLAKRVANGINQKAIDDAEGLGEKDIVGLLGMLFRIWAYYEVNPDISYSFESFIGRQEKRNEPGCYDGPNDVHRSFKLQN